jgi:CzcA family heavy metal efflux pump
MWIVELALKRPYTFIVMALLILIIGPIVVLQTPTDIFPEINIPVVSVIWNYNGLPPQEMADHIVSPYERILTTTVNDIEHTESQSLPGVAVIKIFFRPGANIPTAIAQVTAISQTATRQLPQGTTPPLVITYSASSVPILQVGLSSPTLSEQELNDIGLNSLRTRLITVQGAAVPFPYGGKARQVTVDLDTRALQSKGLTPVDIVNAVSAQNLILPSGTAKLGETEYNVELNGAPQSIAELNDLPVKTADGSTIYLREVAHVRDGFSPQTNVVRQDGTRGSLLSVVKNGGASTLSIVKNIRNVLPIAAQSLPEDLKITPLFDQSLFVRAAVQGVVREGLIAAGLTALMILLFLGDWRSTLIIAISIPLSILTSIIVLSSLGETINIMTLGGLALAVGILVDDATVAIENIDRHLEMGKPLRAAILDGSHEVATPALVSTLCICIVFVPMFFLTGVAKFLFVPLAESVVFAMLASYVLSRTLVPTLVMYLIPEHSESSDDKRDGLFARYQKRFEAAFENFRENYQDLLQACLDHRKAFVACFLVFCVVSSGLFVVLGSDFFPSVDAGQFRLHLRARSGLRIEETAKLCDEVENYLRQEIPPSELGGILDNIGLPYSGINLSYSNAGTIGTGDGEILVSLAPEHHKSTAAIVHHLREELPKRFPGVEFFFQPSDIVTQILNFGLPAPIDVQVVGPNGNTAKNYEIAQKIAREVRHVPGAADVHVQQLLDEPTLHVDVDRTRAQQVGVNARDVAQNLLVSLSSSFQTAPTFWVNPKTGVNYNVSVQSPQYRVDSMQAMLNTPIAGTRPASPQVLSNLVTVTPAVRPAVVTHYNIAPVIDIYASVQDRDLGGVARDVNRVLAEYTPQLPRGSQIVVRGQVQTMNSSFVGLGIGLLGAIVLVYLLIVVNFQSWTDPFIIITALPAAVAGIAWMLLVTQTPLSVPALTGAIMCMGVATANSILVVSFARQRMDAGETAIEAALQAGFTRLRPVLMTALAMMIGMLPMALGFGEGGEQNAPLGRAVIGGLLFATVSTLLFVPSIFTIIHGRRGNEQENAHV